MNSLRNDARPPSPALDAWSRYWGAGALHSCSCAFRGNYDGAVASYWAEQFARLPERATIVDIGTGNGAIALLALDAAKARGATWEIHGVDAARIDPSVSVAAAAPGLQRIRFHSGVSASALPFADASVALVTGQYALEYMPQAAVVGELARVVGRGGRAAFVLHSRDSVVLATTAEQLSHCQLLFEDSVLFAHARVLAPILALASTPEQRRALSEDARAQSSRQELNEAAGMVVDRIEKARTPDLLQAALAAVSEVLKSAISLGEEGVLAYLARHEQALRDEWQRLCDLDEAALDAQGAAALRDRFLAEGFEMAEIGRLQQTPGVELGWTLVALRG